MPRAAAHQSFRSCPRGAHSAAAPLSCPGADAVTAVHCAGVLTDGELTDGRVPPSAKVLPPCQTNGPTSGRNESIVACFLIARAAVVAGVGSRLVRRGVPLPSVALQILATRLLVWAPSSRPDCCTKQAAIHSTSHATQSCTILIELYRKTSD